jgi:hypothetical protein
VYGSGLANCVIFLYLSGAEEVNVDTVVKQTASKSKRPRKKFLRLVRSQPVTEAEKVNTKNLSFHLVHIFTKLTIFRLTQWMKTTPE